MKAISAVPADRQTDASTWRAIAESGMVSRFEALRSGRRRWSAATRNWSCWNAAGNRPRRVRKKFVEAWTEGTISRVLRQQSHFLEAPIQPVLRRGHAARKIENARLGATGHLRRRY